MHYSNQSTTTISLIMYKFLHKCLNITYSKTKVGIVEDKSRSTVLGSLLKSFRSIPVYWIPENTSDFERLDQHLSR